MIYLRSPPDKNIAPRLCKHRNVFAAPVTSVVAWAPQVAQLK